MATRIYVAAKFEEGARVREVHQRLRNLGFEITHDWTQENAEGKTGEALETYLRECAIKDYVGVLDCDLILVLNHDRLFGGCTELGLALAWGRTAYVVEPQIRTNIFFHLPVEMGMRTFPTLDAAIDAIVKDDLSGFGEMFESTQESK